MSDETTFKYVSDLPDLMTWEDHEKCHVGKKFRFRLTLTDGGLEIIGDSPYPGPLEDLMMWLEPESIEAKLCG
jgi:hypothetical protein